MNPSFPARLHVLLASDALSGVVIRRGPAGHVALFGWQRQPTRFVLSQWFKGRIYERRADLSPDGRHLIYFAADHRPYSPVLGSWTAISRAPWLKAVTLYPKGDCWQGGGLWLDNHRYWLNGCHDDAYRDSGEVQRDAVFYPKVHYGGECPSVYYHRLQRDGWQLAGVPQDVYLDRIVAFDKPLSRGWTLVKLAHEQVGPPPGKGCYWDEHRLVDGEGAVHKRPEWEWADWVDGRLLWAEGGCLYRAGIRTGTRLNDTVLLHDFNGYRFEERAAPY